MAEDEASSCNKLLHPPHTRRAYELYQPLRIAPGVEMHDVTVAMNVAVDAGAHKKCGQVCGGANACICVCVCLA